VDTPRPSTRTNRTRRVPHPVLIGHVASLSQAGPTQATWACATRGDAAGLAALAARAEFVGGAAQAPAAAGGGASERWAYVLPRLYGRSGNVLFQALRPSPGVPLPLL